MDHYPEVNVHNRECSSRRPSNSSSILDNTPEQTQALLRNDSQQSEAAATSKRVEEEFAQYTDAPPPYSEKQYEGKSEEQQNKMRMADYAKEIKRMMGRQLVRGIKSEETKVQSSS
ncbi:hypothetical protein BDU57DRAFT_509511 [Ampelomyces quisqualis]|uniref:Uncharacterized protein n=1 Tax=Ampelomyces quisqualis TaxID=50730 RepID=A0A6A5R0K1_AMPQU|nr:hypothetical protein BDU57DRAFT_509511 [Ampelomyces quisqualis]